MRGTWVQCWHPESPGQRLAVWRPWWRRKGRRFATTREVRHSWAWAMPFAAKWHPRAGFYDAIRSGDSA